MRTFHLLGALAAAGLASPAAAATLTFDEAFAPSLFSSARALVGQYADQGVLFGGHGAVLSEVADLGVTGYSGTNFAAYSNGATFKASPRAGETGDSVRFSAAQELVSFAAGSGVGGPFTLNVAGYDEEGALVASTSVALTAALQTVTLGGGFTRLEFALEGAGPFDSFALDDFTFTAGPGFALVPAPAMAGLFGLTLGGLAFARVRARR